MNDWMDGRTNRWLDINLLLMDRQIDELTSQMKHYTGDFLHEDNPVYEDIDKFQELKKFMEEKLEDYNMEPGIIGMDLVLFKDAIEHG